MFMPNMFTLFELLPETGSKIFLEQSDIVIKIMHELLMSKVPAYLYSRSVVKNARQVLDPSRDIPLHEKLLEIHIEYIIEKANEFFNHRL